MQPQYTVLLIDDFTAEPDDFMRSVQAAEQFLKEGVASGVQMAIFGLWEGPVSAFTNDREKLLAALKRLKYHRAILPPMINYTNVTT